MAGRALRAAIAGIILAFAAVAQPRFDVAEIHRSASAANPQSFRSGGFLRGERYDLRKVTMIDLIRLAYGFEPDDVLGGPDWLALTRFDIAAKARLSTSPQDLRLMLQSLLTERFALVLHKDVRPVPAFALTLGKDKPKIRKAEGSGDATCKDQRQPAASAYQVYSCRNMTMAGFAQQLRGIARDYLTDPIVDATGLTGEWDFDLQWNGRSRVLAAGAERTTIFSAIDQQLGLRLTAEKVPGNVIVIDSVNEKPTENAPGVAELLPARALQFDVASVKPSRPDVHDGFSGITTGGGFEARAETMRNLFATAWDVHWDHVDEMIAGMPKWMDSARYDVLAKPAAGTNEAPPPRVDDELRLMLRTLLTDRFKIKTHYENRTVDAYTLVAIKPKLKKADPANRANCQEAHTVENDPRDLNPRLSRLLACQNITMAQFAEQLLAVSNNDFAYAVVDATGISGRWDFMLSYTPTGDRRVPVGAGEGDPSGAILIFEAVKKQLGLRLEMHKRMLPVLVIDHIEEKPTEN
jgi:uncharacterized protein (TIGR03435 family)